MAEQSFQDQLQQSVMIQGILTAMPQLINFYPQLIGLVDMLDKTIEEKLGDNEKMIVLVRRNGVTRMIELNTNIPFTLSNDMKIDAKGEVSPLLNNYEKDEYKAKLLNHSIVQTLKEKYEKRDTTQPQTDQNGIFSMLSKIMPIEETLNDQSTETQPSPLSIEP